MSRERSCRPHTFHSKANYSAGLIRTAERSCRESLSPIEKIERRHRQLFEKTRVLFDKSTHNNKMANNS